MEEKWLEFLRINAPELFHEAKQRFENRDRPYTTAIEGWKNAYFRLHEENEEAKGLVAEFLGGLPCDDLLGGIREMIRLALEQQEICRP